MQMPQNPTNQEEDENQIFNSIGPIKSQTRGQTKDIVSTRFQSFAQMGLSEQLLMGLQKLEPTPYIMPTPIQEEAIPIILDRKNLIARAKNGTGKSGAYLIPFVQGLIRDIDRKIKRGLVKAAVIVSTHQLARQAAKTAQTMCKYTQVTVDCLIGGSDINEDLDKLDDGVQLVVCTAGRLKAILRRRKDLLDECIYFAMDEADALLRDQNQADMAEIMRQLPMKTAVSLFSATFHVRTKDFIMRFLPDFYKVNVMEQLTLLGVAQFYRITQQRKKVQVVRELYRRLRINQCIIFCNRNDKVEAVSEKLNKLGYQTEYLHAARDRADRQRIFQSFKKLQFKTLVCSDLLARGIDIQSVNVVINFDLPSSYTTYLHRVGRSGRYGQKGLAISLIDEYRDAQNIEKFKRDLGTNIDPLHEDIDESLYV